jgi:hypothetical protein
VASQLRALLHGRNFAERDAAISHANHAVKAALYRAGCLEVANLGAQSARWKDFWWASSFLSTLSMACAAYPFG